MGSKSDRWLIWSPDTGTYFDGAAFVKGLENARTYSDRKDAVAASAGLETHCTVHRLTLTPAVPFGRARPSQAAADAAWAALHREGRA